MGARLRNLEGKVPKGPEYRSFCSCGVRVLQASCMCMYALTQKHSEPCSLGILMEAQSCRHD